MNMDRALGQFLSFFFLILVSPCFLTMPLSFSKHLLLRLNKWTILRNEYGPGSGPVFGRSLFLFLLSRFLTVPLSLSKYLFFHYKNIEQMDNFRKRIWTGLWSSFWSPFFIFLLLLSFICLSIFLNIF